MTAVFETGDRDLVQNLLGDYSDLVASAKQAKKDVAGDNLATQEEID